MFITSYFTYNTATAPPCLLAKPPATPLTKLPTGPPPNAVLTDDATPPPTVAALIEVPAADIPLAAPLAAPRNPPATNPSYEPASPASPATATPPVKAPSPIDAANPATFSIGIVCPKPSVSLFCGLIF